MPLAVAGDLDAQHASRPFDTGLLQDPRPSRQVLREVAQRHHVDALDVPGHAGDAVREADDGLDGGGHRGGRQLGAQSLRIRTQAHARRGSAGRRPSDGPAKRRTPPARATRPSGRDRSSRPGSGRRRSTATRRARPRSCRGRVGRVPWTGAPSPRDVRDHSSRAYASWFGSRALLLERRTPSGAEAGHHGTQREPEADEGRPCERDPRLVAEIGTTRHHVRDRQRDDREDPVRVVQQAQRPIAEQEAPRCRSAPGRPTRPAPSSPMTQKRSPGSRLAIHAMSPQTQPTVNSATTKNPTYLWTSVTRRSLRGRAGSRALVPDRAGRVAAVLVQAPGEVEPLQDELERGSGDAGTLLLDTQPVEQLRQAGQIAELREQVARRASGPMSRR